MTGRTARVVAGLLVLGSIGYPAWPQTAAPATGATTPSIGSTPGIGTPGTSTSPSTGASSPAATPPVAAPPPGSPPPVPYTDSEFPAWLRAVRRAEVVTVGAFPITLILTSVAYQGYLYAANDFGPTPQLTTQQQLDILFAGVGVAALVALADFIVGRVTKTSARPVAP